jgi:KTSC domain
MGQQAANPVNTVLFFCFRLLYWHNNSSGHDMPSSVIKAMDYDPALRVLRITYVSGKIYDYLGVPSKVMEEMKRASSKGIFLNRRIKGHYPFNYVG